MITKRCILCFFIVCVFALILPTRYSVLSADNYVANRSGMEYEKLTSSLPFEDQVTKPNTIYEVRSTFDLNNKKVKIPTNCVIKIEGGSIKNGILVLSSFCSIHSVGPNKPVLCNVNVELNKCCEIDNVGFLYHNLQNSIITFNYSSVESGRFRGLPNIIIQNCRFDIRNQKHVGSIFTANADVKESNLNAAGCSGFSFSNLDIYGNLGDGFVFNSIYKNSWINDVYFSTVNQFGSICGWRFNTGHKGSMSHITITNCSYQHEQKTTYAIDAKNVYDLTISGTRFWDFKEPGSSVCRFDTGCWGIYMSNMNSSDIVKPYTIVEGEKDADTDGRIFISNELLYRGDISKFLLATDDITVKDLYKLPNGLYFLSRKTADDYRKHWGVRLGDDYKDNALLRVEKRMSCLFVEVMSSKRISETPRFNKGQMQSIATTNITDTPIKSLWNIMPSIDMVSKSQLNRIEAFEGESRLVETINKPVWWNGKEWIESDGAKAFVLRNGSSRNRPTGNDIYIGFQYFDTDLGQPIWYKGNNIWVDASGNTI